MAPYRIGLLALLALAIVALIAASLLHVKAGNIPMLLVGLPFMALNLFLIFFISTMSDTR